ncbi:hypothetical protein ACFPTO_15040 [Paraburkholderia denitrificans]|uniref:DUF4148 domain-containing protein n=1 Tax=Paraburkholderia denitrificans TaxID=694025 RepID=A0ABW0JAJ0_9BURK
MSKSSTTRIALACAAASFAGFVFAADSQSDPPQATNPPAAQDVGGAPMSTGAAGGPMAITHEQVYQELIRSEQTGERDRLDRSVYRGQ